MPAMSFYTSCTHVPSGACSECAGKMDARIKELRIALRTICRTPWKAFDLADEALNADDRRI